MANKVSPQDRERMRISQQDSLRRRRAGRDFFNRYGESDLDRIVESAGDIPKEKRTALKAQLEAAAHSFELHNYSTTQPLSKAVSEHIDALAATASRLLKLLTEPTERHRTKIDPRTIQFHLANAAERLGSKIDAVDGAPPGI